MKYRAQNTRILTPNELLSILCKSAKIYSEYVDTTLLFIFREKKADACIDGTISKKDCTPRRDANTMYSKVAIMEQMLDLRNSKCYKIGEKDLVTRDNDFEMATGNSVGVMGYDSRIRIKGTNKLDKTKSPIPTTLLNNSITQYCSRPQKIMFILQKSDGEDTYNKLFYEIKKDLILTEYEVFTDELKELIKIDM